MQVYEIGFVPYTKIKLRRITKSLFESDPNRYFKTFTAAKERVIQRTKWHLSCIRKWKKSKLIKRAYKELH